MNRFLKTFLVVTLLLLVCGILVAPVSAATQEVTVIKYAANNYSYAESSVTRNWTEMESSMTKAYSNGPVYMQGPTFDSADPYGTAGQNMILYYGHNGTYVKDLTDLAGGMSAGDEIFVKASDGMTRYFNYTNVYAPASGQGELVLAWWDSSSGAVPGYSEGIRSFFYTPASSYGVSDSLNFTLVEMRDSLAPWYRYNYSTIWPSAKGLSVKYVNQLKIYPPHRHDFNTAGDTTGWAYKGEVSSDPPGTIDVPGTLISPASDIADDDSAYEWVSSSAYYAAQRFNFSINTATDKDGPVNKIEKLSVTWAGSGTHDTASKGATLYIWDGSSYEELASTDSDSEATLTGSRSSSLENYINSGNVTAIVVQKSPGTSVSNQSIIATDYVNMTVTHHHSNM